MENNCHLNGFCESEECWKYTIYEKRAWKGKCRFLYSNCARTVQSIVMYLCVTLYWEFQIHYIVSLKWIGDLRYIVLLLCEGKMKCYIYLLHEHSQVWLMGYANVENNIYVQHFQPDVVYVLLIAGIFSNSSQKLLTSLPRVGFQCHLVLEFQISQPCRKRISLACSFPMTVRKEMFLM